MKNKKIVQKETLIRNEIDPELVRETINKQVLIHEKDKEKRVAELEKLREQYAEDKKNGNAEKNWVKAPDKNNDKLIQMYNDWILREQNYYSLVRVIENTALTDKRFYLVYGNNKDEGKGTGPFISFDRAKEWFLNQGR